MLGYAIIAFAIGAIGGLYVALCVLTDKFAPWPVSIAHALLGATGMILLLALLSEGHAESSSSATLGLFLFIMAALGGFFLASFHAQRKFPPKAFVIVHASLAVLGFLALLSVVQAL